MPSAEGNASGGGGGSVDGESPLESEERGEQQGVDGEEELREDEGEETKRMGEEEEAEVCASLRGLCADCGGRTPEAYFDRWTELLRERLAAADRDMASGRVSKGRRGLAAVQVREGDGPGVEG